MSSSSIVCMSFFLPPECEFINAMCIWSSESVFVALVSAHSTKHGTKIFKKIKICISTDHVQEFGFFFSVLGVELRA
jgi:hypothetical protein